LGLGDVYDGLGLGLDGGGACRSVANYVHGLGKGEVGGDRERLGLWDGFVARGDLGKALSGDTEHREGLEVVDIQTAIDAHGVAGGTAAMIFVGEEAGDFGARFVEGSARETPGGHGWAAYTAY
jgi:hypothetical protein